MAMNYGALVVRILLQPTEEAARLLFSKQGADLRSAVAAVAASVSLDTAAAASSAAASGTAAGITGPVGPGADGGRAVVACAGSMGRSLSLLLKAVGLLGSCIVCLGPPMVPAVLVLLPGDKWAAVPEVNCSAACVRVRKR